MLNLKKNRREGKRFDLWHLRFQSQVKNGRERCGGYAIGVSVVADRGDGFQGSDDSFVFSKNLCKRTFCTELHRHYKKDIRLSHNDSRLLSLLNPRLTVDENRLKEAFPEIHCCTPPPTVVCRLHTTSAADPRRIGEDAKSVGRICRSQAAQTRAHTDWRSVGETGKSLGRTLNPWSGSGGGI